MTPNRPFFNLYQQGFVRTAVAIPRVRVADPLTNAEEAVALMKQAVERRVLLVAFPELHLSAYSCEDLFRQQALLEACREGLDNLLTATRGLPVIAVIGLPLAVGQALYNCAAVVYRGQLLGVVPKTFIPNYGEFYEGRQFASGDAALPETVDLCGQTDIPFGNRLLFQVREQPHFIFAVEICEDVWVPIPPSSTAALAGATVLVNVSASNITVGKADYRRQLAASQSGRCVAAYMYCAAGGGESTTDLAWDGHGMIYENGTRLAESERFHQDPQLASADIDLDRLVQDRLRQNTFAQAAARHRAELQRYRTVRFSASVPNDDQIPLERLIERFPYVPSDPSKRDRRCGEVYRIQSQALVKRLRATGIEKLVIGVSGGLDSTQALLVCAQAMDTLGLPRENILAFTMPGFATGERTLRQARELITALGCEVREIDIRPSCLQMLKDIEHPFANDEPVYDVTFENVQAGERTSHLFRLANHHHGLVVGTSDLSELALGWSTYGVGDHMAHYHVNASVPKTLIQHLIRWVAERRLLGADASRVLTDILETEISPELTPGDGNADQPAQKTQEIVGPYELQDFHLYYILRFGYSPRKVAFLAYSAWRDASKGEWPSLPENERRAYGIGEVKHWLKIFLDRFFRSSQFKRSCIANSPKVGSGGSLSPRGDYRAPSDSVPDAWLAELVNVPDWEPR